VRILLPRGNDGLDNLAHPVTSRSRMGPLVRETLSERQ
jgi:hypothetical protein